MDCNSGICSKCKHAHKLVLGVLLLLNAWVWPKWIGLDGWITFVAVLMVIGGLVHLWKPSCGHCNVDMPKKKGKK